MPGPQCSATVTLDVSHLKDGDCAGFAAFNDESGVLAVKKRGKKLFLEMSETSVQLTDRDKEVTKADEKVVESIPLSVSTIYLRIDADFRPNGQNRGYDAANFFYSLDGQQWQQIGIKDYHMRFDWRRFFMGSKFAIFCYATKRTGGYIDVDAFNFVLKP